MATVTQVRQRFGQLLADPRYNTITKQMGTVSDSNGKIIIGPIIAGHPVWIEMFNEFQVPNGDYIVNNL
jgi:hypothetical protein